MGNESDRSGRGSRGSRDKPTKSIEGQRSEINAMLDLVAAWVLAVRGVLSRVDRPQAGVAVPEFELERVVTQVSCAVACGYRDPECFRLVKEVADLAASGCARTVDASGAEVRPAAAVLLDAVPLAQLAAYLLPVGEAPSLSIPDGAVSASPRIPTALSNLARRETGALSGLLVRIGIPAAADSFACDVKLHRLGKLGGQPFTTRLAPDGPIHLAIAKTDSPSRAGELLHEIGHAMHFAAVRPDLPNYRRVLFCDFAAESYAFLLQSLSEVPGYWRRLGMTSEDARAVAATAASHRGTRLERHKAVARAGATSTLPALLATAESRNYLEAAALAAALEAELITWHGHSWWEHPSAFERLAAGMSRNPLLQPDIKPAPAALL